MNETTDIRPVGHVLVPAAAIGSLAWVLAAGLGALGVLARADFRMGDIIAGKNAGLFPNSLPLLIVWAATVFVSYGLAAAMLAVGGTWRRCILWITTIVLIAGWAPVLVLAAHAPTISGPLIACLWSGMCALVYTRNHRMAGDGNLTFTRHGAR